MKKKFFYLCILLTFLVEIVVLVIFACQTPTISQDPVAVNDIVYKVTNDFDSLDKHVNMTELEYVVLDNDENILYKTKSGLSESQNAAIMHRDTILDIKKEGGIVGKLIIYNESLNALQEQKEKTILTISIVVATQGIICLSYAIYMYMTIEKPFKTLKGFAERVACGNLDIPLTMDRRNIFGAFTESFDIMRSELKKARIAEAKAQQSKKELVAKLSHDIKTPVASIKAVSEVGLALTSKEKDKAYYKQIINKTDQINNLVSNLFSATLEELEQLTISPTNIESFKVKSMLENADYLHYATIKDLPECLIYADGLRLQQVFDNIFANSYKYAKTEIAVTYEKDDDYLNIVIEDSGGGVKDQELVIIKEKFKRGENAKNIEGAGLGLYISDYFMKEMAGELRVENGARGLKVIVCLLLSGKN